MSVHTGQGQFVGRERELTELTAALDAALEGDGRLCLLVGEPGVGKTTLAERLCEAAARRGARVARGPCWDAGGAPAYWPWIQVVRTLTRDEPDDVLRARLGRGAADLVTLVPELRERLGDLPPPPEIASDERRFALFDAVGAYLVATAASAPVVLLLDDVHGADEGSLLLLTFVARQLHGTRLLIVTTQRDVAASPSPAVVNLLADVAREGVRLPLRGLGSKDVARLIELRAGVAPTDELLRSVLRITAGNPFFVDEIVRLLAAEGSLRAGGYSPPEIPLPDTVRDAIGKRLAPLDEGTRALLEVAAVAGAEFSVALLAEAREQARADVLERLERAERLGLVAESPDAPRSYVFAHALIRETLYRDLSGTERMAHHRALAEALERLHVTDLDEHLAALAFHYMEAVPISLIGKAVEYARRAGEHAARQLAYEEAARHFAHALSIMDAGRGDDTQRCELLLALGAAQRRAGTVALGRETFGDAARLARDLGAGELLARAALGYAGPLGGPGLAARTDEAVVALLEEALATLRREPTPERSQLLSRLALELYYTPEVARREQLSQEALDIATALDDPRSRMIALYSRHWSTLGPDHSDERRAAAGRLLDLARGSDDLEMRFSAHHFHMAAALERGDLAGVDAEIDACARIADALRQPLYHWQAGLMHAMRALLQGRADEGERLALEAYEAGRVVDDETAANLLAAQLFHHRWTTGRLAELADAIDVYAAQRPWIPAWRCGAAFLRSEIGQHEAARVELDAVGAGGFADLPRDGNWAMGVSIAGLAAATIGAVEHAAALYPQLDSISDRVVVLAAGDVSLGPAALPAAAVAALLEMWDEAEAHFETAHRIAARIDARPVVATCHYERARMLLARRGPGDEAAAATEARRALELAEQLGMTRIIASAGSLLEEQADGADPGAPAPAVRTAVLERTGDVWRVGVEPAVTLLKHSKGLGYLAQLLEHPGVEFHALDLVIGRSAGAGLGDAGPRLDAAAKSAYRARIAELEEEIEQAESWADPERAASARQELAALTQELAGAVGLGGRDRRDSSAAERARVNVTRAIRSAIQRVADHDPVLGHDLDASVHTGTFSTFTPPPSPAIKWVVARAA
jgi:hypothetical protein